MEFFQWKRFGQKLTYQKEINVFCEKAQRVIPGPLKVPK
jgi:hypothetical protein